MAKMFEPNKDILEHAKQDLETLSWRATVVSSIEANLLNAYVQGYYRGLSVAEAEQPRELDYLKQIKKIFSQYNPDVHTKEYYFDLVHNLLTEPDV